MDERIALAIDASRRWYEAVFAMHGSGFRSDGRLWVAASEPPPWHSAVKTLTEDVRTDEVLAAAEANAAGGVADSFGTLDLAPRGFDLLIDASWMFHPGIPAATWPEGWTVVDDPGLLSRWSAAHDYAGVLLPEVLEDPAFQVLAALRDGSPVAGAVVHGVGRAAGVSNVWSRDGLPSPEELSAVLACAGVIHPGLPVVDYAEGAERDAMLDVGYERLGPQRVWLRR